MSYDPTQQVPPPQGYPPQYPTQQVPPPPPAAYPQPPAYPQQPYTQQSYPTPQPPGPPTYQQYSTPPGQPGAGFDFNAFWRNLGRNGQVCLIGGVVLLITLFMPWLSASSTSTNAFGGTSSYSETYNAFQVATNNGSSNLNETSFWFTLVWLVILASITLIVLPIMIGLGKMQARQGQMFILITAGVAFLVELAFMIQAFSLLSASDRANLESLGIKFYVGPGFGFWLGLLATLAAGGVYLYFGYIKKPAGSAYGALPYPATPQYPGSQPYQQPQYPGSQPYQPPTQQYPGSQPPPYQPPTQYQQPPQYPGQPPQYPGQ
jgi:hypothetical protein